MKHIEVLSVTKEGKTINVVKEITNDDDTTELNLHMFHEDTLSWRAAEYGIDPNDFDTLIDIVLYEPHLDPDTPQLYTYSTRDEARTNHILKIAEVKNKFKKPKAVKKVGLVATPQTTVPDRYKGDLEPYAGIRQYSVMEHIDKKVEHVEQMFQLRDEILNNIGSEDIIDALEKP